MSDTDLYPPAPATNVWDSAAVLDQAKKVLRVQTGDEDETRVADSAATATKLVDDYVDHREPEPASASMVTAAVQLTIEIYRRKDAPFGVAGGWSTDSVPVFLSADVLKSAYSLIRSDKERWGIG